MREADGREIEVNGRQPHLTRPPGWRLHLLRYLVVGGLSVLIDVGLLVVLHERLGVPLALATTIAFGTSLVANFLLNRLAMSTRGAEGMTRHAFRYLALVAVNYLITLVAVTMAPKVGISYVVAKLAIVLASTIWNFLLYRYWVFAPTTPRKGVTDGRVVSLRAQQADYSDQVPRRTSGGLLVVIPAFNEEETVGHVVSEVGACLPDAGVLVVDDASVDATRDRALAQGAMVLTLPFNLGVGGAMRAGFRFALRNGFGSVIQIDADGQHDPGDAHRLVAALDEADLVIGSRFSGRGSYDIRGPRRWAMRVLSAILSDIAGTKLDDTTSGFRATGPRAVELFARHYPAEYLGDTVESIVISARANLIIRQVPVTMRARAGGLPSQSAVRAALYLFRACLAICFAGIRRTPHVTVDSSPERPRIDSADPGPTAARTPVSGG